MKCYATDDAKPFQERTPLMRNVNARGSSYVIGPRDEVIAVKRGRTYEPVGQERMGLE